jgi:phosphatidylserine synthase
MLMVSRIRYPHVFNRLLRGFRPLTTLVEIVVAAVLFFVLHQVAIFVCVVFYVLSGPALGLRRLVLAKPESSTEPGDESVH